MMKYAMTQASLVIAMLFCVASASSLAAEPSMDDKLPSISSLEEWDKAAEILRSFAWSMHEGKEIAGKDVRGRTPEDDANAYVMPEPVSARLAELRATADKQKASGDETGLAATLALADVLFQEALLRSWTLWNYWRVQMAVAFHENLFRKILPDSKSDRWELVGKSFRETRTTLADLLNKELAEPVDMMATHKSSSIYSEFQLRAASFNKARAELYAETSRTRNASSPPPRSRQRQGECGPPAEPLNDSGKPSVIDMRESLDKFYPPQSKEALVEGSVILKLTVSATGCMENAEIVDTEGSDELGDAALEAAEYINFAPARVDGKAVRASMLLRQKFELKDE